MNFTIFCILLTSATKLFIKLNWRTQTYDGSLNRKFQNNHKKQVRLQLHSKSTLLQMFLVSAVVKHNDLRHPKINNPTHDGILSARKRCNSLLTQDKILYDPVKLMILIYVCNDDSLPQKHVSKCKISPSTGVINYRTDLEFYVFVYLSRYLKCATTLSSIGTQNLTICFGQWSKSAS